TRFLLSEGARARVAVQAALSPPSFFEEENMSKLTWIEKPVRNDWYSRNDSARHEAEVPLRPDLPPYLIRARTTNGKTFFILSRGMQHYTTVRNLERAKAVAEAKCE